MSSSAPTATGKFTMAFCLASWFFRTSSEVWLMYAIRKRTYDFVRWRINSTIAVERLLKTEVISPRVVASANGCLINVL